MKKLGALLMALALTPLAYGADKQPDFLLDKIAFQMSARQWVTTNTALLTVNINATLDNANLVKARNDIMARLSKIAKGEWHITDFKRSQDSSGLEKLFVKAEARVGQESLTNIYQNAKSVSQPGAKYSIANIAFKPSLEETQAVRAKVREQLYQQVSDEIKRINQRYEAQKYSLSQLMFIEGDEGIQPKAREMTTMMMAAASSPAVTVSNEITMTAMAEAASNRTRGD